MTKTVATIITPLGEGGIGVIQVAGALALKVVGEIFVAKRFNSLEMCVNNQLIYGVVCDQNNNQIDEVIINVCKGEGTTDLVEINCHGGVYVVNKIMETLECFGVCKVEWQEFILNVRDLRLNAFPEMDLIRKEALELLPGIMTRLGSKVILDQYNGALSWRLFEIIGKLEDVEPALDVKDRASGVLNISSRMSVILSDMKDLIASFNFGKALTQPENVIIVGRPNVGKSSLINKLLGKDRVLVHHEPGTTRDPVSEFISVEGIPLHIIDTAGLRDTDHVIERKSIELTKELMSKVNKFILVFDSACQIKKEDIGIIKSLCSGLKARRDSDADDRYVHLIPVLNKSDLPETINEYEIIKLLEHGKEYMRMSNVVRLSTLNNTGIVELEKAMVAEFDDFIEYCPGMAVLFTERQFDLLSNAYKKLGGLQDSARGKIDTALNVIEESKHFVYNCMK